jgi:hypothetical protein
MIMLTLKYRVLNNLRIVKRFMLALAIIFLLL